MRRTPLVLLLWLSLHGLSTAGQPAYGAVPHERQIAWHRLEYYGFVHLGLNTFTDREWGYGDEDPKLFNPSAFDALAIVRHFKAAGMQGVIITAKHHDGFCLWPTKTTAHNITRSPWKNGKGDVLKDFSDACRAENFKLGIYVSPWDRNHAEYGREGYVKDYHEQIREVTTHYGPLFEIWFDGANGGDGWYGGAREKRSIPEGYYQFPKAAEMIRKLQPDCVIWSAGDARWGGSEQGHVAYPHWHTMDTVKQGDLATGVPHGNLWVPAEGDVSIRPGWFWHEREDAKVKTPEKLLRIWFDSVGRGANLILNVPPDRDGRIREADVRSLTEFRKLRDALFTHNFANGAKGAAELTDDDIDSAMSATSFELRLATQATFDVIRLREQIRLGQRVDSFAVDAWTGGTWREIHAGQTIGHQRLIHLPQPVTTEQIRLRITASTGDPHLSELSLFRMPEIRQQSGSAASPGKVSKASWKITACSAGAAEAAIDDDPETLWHTHMQQEMNPPQSFEVDMGATIRVSAFTYLPRQDGVLHGMTDKFRIETSADGSVWQKAAEGEFSNIAANPIEQTISLPALLSARWFRFTGLHAIEREHISAAEVGVIAAP